MPRKSAFTDRCGPSPGIFSFLLANSGMATSDAEPGLTAAASIADIIASEDASATNASQASYSFTVTYAGPTPSIEVDVATLNDTNVEVVAPDGTILAADFVSSVPATSANSVAATYRILRDDMPADAWAAGDYTARLADTGGGKNSVANLLGVRANSGNLDTFAITIEYLVATWTNTPTSNGVNISATSTGTLRYNYGDGTSGATGSRNYATAGTRTIGLYTQRPDLVTQLRFDDVRLATFRLANAPNLLSLISTNSSISSTLNAADLPRTLRVLDLRNGSWRGNMSSSDWPSTLTQFNATGAALTLSGNVSSANWPSTLTQFNASGNALTLSGNVSSASWPAALARFFVSGAALTLSGNVSSANWPSGLTLMAMNGNALTLSGDVSSANWPSTLTQFNAQGDALTLSGDVSSANWPSTLTRFSASGTALTLSGDVSSASWPAALTLMTVSGNALTLSGNVSSANWPSTLTQFNAQGNALTLSGNVSSANWPSTLTRFFASGTALTLSGNVSSANWPSTLTQFLAEGNAMTLSGTLTAPNNWPANLNSFTVGGISLTTVLATDFSAARAALRTIEIRNYVISQADLDAIADSLINDTTLSVNRFTAAGLRNAASAPVALSTTRITSLTGRGITVTTV